MIECFRAATPALLLTFLLGITGADAQSRIDNPAEPERGTQTVALEEVWRLDGENEDLLLGVINDVAMDDSGRIYLLDSQLHEVQVIAPDGEWLNTIGREGEGPGEFHRPNGLLALPDGTIGVVQSRPGKIVLLSADGEPMGEIKPPGSEDGMVFMGGVNVGGDGLIMQVNEGRRTDTGFAMTQRIVEAGTDGAAKGDFAEKSFERDFSNTAMRERDSFGFRRWAGGPDGRVYINHEFEKYEIEVYSDPGTKAVTVARSYEPRVRSAEEKEAVSGGVRIRGPRRMEMEFEASDTDPAIIRMFPREDGTLWVLSSRGAYDAPDGVLGTFDVFDAKGKFIQQVQLQGNGSARDDGFFFLGQDRFIVVEELVDARRAAFGGGEGEDEEEIEVEPLSVVCYRIPSVRSDGAASSD